MYAVILCGGAGKRLWPMSRKDSPKQFLRLYSERSLLQETYLRLVKIFPHDHIFFITIDDYYSKVIGQIRVVDPGFPAERVISQPENRETFPAYVMALKHLTEKNGVLEKEPIFFFPSDHHIEGEEDLQETISLVVEEVDDHLGYIGIKPYVPYAEYGYMKIGRMVKAHWELLSFHEKPSEKNAQKYINEKNYLWNTGICCLTFDTFRKEVSELYPDVFELMEKGYGSLLDNFTALPAIPFDPAISEKTKKAVVFRGSFGWSDLGTFDNLWDTLGGE